MRITPDRRVVWSASDLKAAAECEFAWLRALDAKLGRIPAVPDPEDAMLERAARLGDRHEERVLAAYRAEFPGRVVEIERTRSTDADALAAAVAQSLDALRSDAEVVFQAAFATEDFVGFADFLRRDGTAWRVQDSKLARRARSTALMQLAAYVDQLRAAGIPAADEVDLLLGDGTVSTHRVDDLMPLFRVRRDRLRALIADRDPAGRAEPIAWGDQRGDLAVVACGRCATCEEQVLAERDLLLVAGMRPVQRERLRAAGIRTIDQLAHASESPPRMSPEVFEALVGQAALQVESEGRPVPAWRVSHPSALGLMPRPSLGDIFFDFEGDPLHSESRDGTTVWGLDYLFGWVDNDEAFSALWAHTLAEEKQAFETFLDLIALRRETHPDLHIYHYAPYEPVHLAAMAARHGVREAEVDALLREEVFVDLYPVARRALTVGTRSYSIKKLEPLYMGEQVRTQEVQKGDDSIIRYVVSRELAASGDAAAAQEILDDLADYNRYDCISTRRLRDWLIERAREHGVTPAGPSTAPDRDGAPTSERAEHLRARSADVNDDDARALRLAAAATDYYPQESKAFWRAHFERLREPIGLWADTRDVLVVDPAESRVIDDWHDGRQSRRRVMLLRGEIAPGSRWSVGGSPHAVYTRPVPFDTDASPRLMHVTRDVTVAEVRDDGVIVTETSPVGGWDDLPSALAPAAPPRTITLEASIARWADTLLASPTLPEDAATDILRRRPPRTRSGALARSEDVVGSIVTSILELDNSYLAVQGPPGTGKTHVGAHVIARLVIDHGYRVGVVAQSHAVVENLLERVVQAGVPGERVGKAPGSSSSPTAHYTVLRKGHLARFIAGHQRGFVVGGTAWDYANDKRVAERQLDLLVIDEAGQFSLANTIACARSARSILLLGDPQQLPQVSQGSHVEPVDSSALGWILDERATLPESHGYFLAESWRMHPAVAEAVTHLSYDGRLHARAGTELRAIEGITPGLHLVPTRHIGDATSSEAEAEEVVLLVRDLIGRAVTDLRTDDDGSALAEPPRPLTEADIIVVAPYNAQQVLVEQRLAEAGFREVRVGTVDKFQGQEAIVSIVTLTASSGRDAPRGSDFLLLQNRLNVAVSRAKVAAYLIHSPALLDDLPHTAEGVARLSAFARLVGRG